MGRFFPFRRPQRGMPICLRGLARGLAKMDAALSGMSVENGRVEWSANDVPHLVFGDDGAGSCPEFIRNVKEIVGDWINEAKTTVVGDADIAVPTQDSIETRTTESDGDVLQLYDFDDPPEYTVPPDGSKPKIVLRDDVSSSVPSIAYGTIPDLAESILDEFTAGDGISIDVSNRTISVDAEQIAGSIGDILDPPEVPPPCGHPGNEPGAGGESEPGDDTEHPGDESGDTDHPGDSPSPPSSGECP